MTSGVFQGTSIFGDSSAMVSPAADLDATRGRKRSRSLSRTNVDPKPVQADRLDESSTLRGRSRRRATSPVGHSSRTSSPTIISPTTQRLYHVRLRQTRREHCPSRVTSPTGQQRTVRRRQRTRSRSRGLRRDQEHARPHDILSGLRNVVLANENEDQMQQGN